MSKSKVLFQLSGSIACYKACEVISKLVQSGVEVRTAVSSGALEFIGRSTLEGLTGHPVFEDTYTSGRAMDHLTLSRWSDLAILCPATAKTINELATGVGDSALTTLFLGFPLGKKPYFIAPAMNEKMLSHPATQESLVRLTRYGARVLPTSSGHLACGEEGLGRLLEPEIILREILAHLPRKEPHESLTI